VTHDNDNVQYSKCYVSTRERSPQFIGHETKTFEARGSLYPAGENFTKC